MKSENKFLDKFQIIGFLLSTALSVFLLINPNLIFQISPAESVILGIVVGIGIQLFDIQMRNQKAEERLHEANRLSQVLFHDKWLLGQIQTIVRDYYTIQAAAFKPFTVCAKDTLRKVKEFCVKWPVVV